MQCTAADFCRRRLFLQAPGAATSSSSSSSSSNVLGLEKCPPLRKPCDSLVLLLLSRSETWVPKRGGLKPAGKRQESATFLQRSFFDVAVQFFVCCSAASGPNDFRTAEKLRLQCSFCSAAFQKLQRNFRFRLWHVVRAGFWQNGFFADFYF